MHVFSSMHAEDIVADERSTKGVIALRRFLGFAERGFIDDAQPTGREPDSDFEVSVARALRAHGFECAPQVGVAGFYIDIGVKDPTVPGRFLLGVECDGASYHSGKSARDRDRLRQEILEQLGWKIRRIWSTDWFRDPHACIARLVAELKQLAAESRPPVEISEVATVSQLQEEECEEDVQVESYVAHVGSLRECLESFAEKEILPNAPANESNRRLLRPAMIEALCEFRPATMAEFTDKIPHYLRDGTDPREGRYLGQVLDIVAKSESA